MKIRFKSIESRLTLYVLIFSVLLGVFFSAIQIGFDYVGDEQRVQLQTREMLRRQQPSTALALFNYDESSLQTALDSMRMNLGIVAVEVVEFGSDFRVHSGWDAEQRNTPDNRDQLLVYRVDLMKPVTSVAGEDELGVLSVWVDRRLLHKGFEQRAGLTLVLDVLRNIVLAVVLIMVFRARLTGPVKRLTEKVLQIDPQAPMRIPLKVESQLEQSELDDLVAKTNALLASMDEEMSHRYVAEKQVRFLNEKLEEKVRDRTRELHDTNQQLQASITELTETQSLLVKAQHMAALGQLASGMAHEINNPIAVVSSNLSTLNDYLTDLIDLASQASRIEQQIPDDAIKAQLKKIRDSVDLDFVEEDAPDLLRACSDGIERVKLIVKELQTFVGGEDQDIKELNDLSALFWKAARESQVDSSADIHISHNFDLVVDPILCNSQQVVMVLSKILHNAQEAMPCGGTIEAALLEDSHNLVLAIKDNGVGMTEEDLQFATNPFFTRKEVGQGMGMGLTVAYNVMANHNGSLEIDSAPDVGTCVTLRFPRQ